MSVAPSRIEAFLRFSRRSMWVLLGLIVLLGTLGVGLALAPDDARRAFGRIAWAVPIAVVVVGAALRAASGGATFTRDEQRLVLADEWRRASLDRARRVAFGAVLVAQLPLAVWLRAWPAPRAVAAMAVATITVALGALAAAFLFFDGSARDE